MENIKNVEKLKQELEIYRKQLEEVDKNIETKQEERYELSQKCRQLLTQIRVATLDKAQLRLGDCFVYENDAVMYHDEVFEAITLLDINTMQVKYLKHTLRVDDGEATFFTKLDTCGFTSFISELDDKYRRITREEYNEFIRRGLGLEIYEE